MAYFSNGTEGEYLARQCEACPVGRADGGPCPVRDQCLAFNYEQWLVGQEKLRACLQVTIGEDGKCKMKAAMERVIPASWLDNEHGEG